MKHILHNIQIVFLSFYKKKKIPFKSEPVRIIPYHYEQIERQTQIENPMK